MIHWYIDRVKMKLPKTLPTLLFPWLYNIIMSLTSFRVNLHSIVCLKAKESLARSRFHILSFSESNGIWSHNHLVRKQTLNHLAKLTKWLKFFVSTYLHGAFDCMLLSCHVRDSAEFTLYSLPECQGSPCSKQALYLKFKWQQRGPNHNQSVAVTYRFPFINFKMCFSEGNII